MQRDDRPFSMKTEAIAGVTTFFTMAYIIFVNPQLLATPGTGMSFSGVMTATVLLCFSMTLLMGLYANIPFAVAPGMGLNAFFAFSIVLGRKVPWQQALGITFWAGVVFLLISVTPVRVAIARAIPRNLRVGAAAGIGVFLTFLGLKAAGLVVANPATFVSFGGLSQETALAVMGMFLGAVLMRRRSPFAFLATILVITGIALIMGKVKIPEAIFRAPDFTSVFLKLDIRGALQLALLPAMFSILLTDLFDSISTFVGVAQSCGITDERGEPRNLKQGLIVDAVATFSAGLLGTSSGTAYIESAAGVEAGGRTGWTSVFTALCFLPFLFVSPLAEMIPGYATAPVLILVGAMMFRTVKELTLDTLEDLIPPYLTIVLIPLTFSITQGLLWGFLSHVLLYTLAGRAKQLSPTLLGLAGISAVMLLLEGR